MKTVGNTVHLLVSTTQHTCTMTHTHMPNTSMHLDHTHTKHTIILYGSMQYTHSIHTQHMHSTHYTISYINTTHITQHYYICMYHTHTNTTRVHFYWYYPEPNWIFTFGFELYSKWQQALVAPSVQLDSDVWVFKNCTYIFIRERWGTFISPSNSVQYEKRIYKNRKIVRM